MDLLQRMYVLKGVVQHYSWGGYEFIPGILGEKNLEQKPWAEYWLGAHPNHPSTVLPQGIKLDELIAQDPSGFLGSEAAARFGRLPYLLKLLDVRQMLSIQVHPSRDGAEKGFDEENGEGLPLNAFNRNYKDRNHKPELMVALGDFWLLHGFKDAAILGLLFDATPELKPLQASFTEGGYRGLYEEVMMMDADSVNAILDPLMKRIIPLYQAGELEKDEEDYWAAKAAIEFCKQGQYDRGIFSIYFFNLVYLKQGEAVFQPEGMPHAYLEGQNIEVMANSDNVLRAGLTDKHIDVPELLKHVNFQATTPRILASAGGDESVYETPAAEFELHRMEIAGGDGLVVEDPSPATFLLLHGAAMFESGSEAIQLEKGGALFAAAGSAVRISTGSSAVIFKVTIPKGPKNKSE